MKKIFLLTIIVSATILTGCTLPWQKTPSVACTMEAKLCSDGSLVGRSGPKCEFASCPTPKLCTDGTVCPVATTTQLANPASVNCKDKGGNLVMKTRGDGGQYGLCYFEDNRACEEWALFRGDCPYGGMKTTGYDTEAQKYCAWLGGSTVAQSNANCTLKNGSVCSNDELYNGTCPSTNLKSSATVVETNGNKVYTNKEFGFSFSFPNSWAIEDKLPATWQTEVRPSENLSIENIKNRTFLNIHINNAGFGPLFPDITYVIKKQENKLILSDRQDVPNNSEEIGGIDISQRTSRQIIAYGDNIMLIYTFDINKSDGEAMFKKIVSSFNLTK